MLKKIIVCIFLFILILFVVIPSIILPSTNNSKSALDVTVKGVVKNINNISSNGIYGSNIEGLSVLIENGDDKGKSVDIFYEPNGTTQPKLGVGDEIVLIKILGQNSSSYIVTDKYRFDRVLIIIFLFFALIFLVAGRKGFASILGLVISLVAIIGYVFPQIIEGKDPLTTVIFASFFILLITTFVAHGISKRTVIALLSTSLALLLTIVLSSAAVKFVNLTGYSTDDAMDLHYLLAKVNIKGLFLSGIIITTLGALNDITIVQATTIFQIAKIKKDIRFLELVEEGFVVGREHVVSLINTLVLAYAGSSVSLLLGFFLIPTSRPFWAIISNELVAEEIVKTVAGTAGLVLSVPIVTFLTSYILTYRTYKNKTAS